MLSLGPVGIEPVVPVESLPCASLAFHFQFAVAIAAAGRRLSWSPAGDITVDNDTLDLTKLKAYLAGAGVIAWLVGFGWTPLVVSMVSVAILKKALADLK